MSALYLEDVEFGHGDRRVLSKLSLDVADGEVVALLGPSGSGKSTILRLLLGFAAPAVGSVRIDDVVVSRVGGVLVPPEERRLAVVFQDLALWPHLTVRGNLAFGLRALAVGAAAREQRVREMLAAVGLAEKADCRPAELSGGERQRVAIARALVLEPRAVLLDEPLSNLDVQLKRELLTSFRSLFKQRGSTVLYVSHDLREAASLADRIAVLEEGRIVQEGTLAELRSRPETAFVNSLLTDFAWTHVE